jgi:hypothetical protein
VLSFYLIVSRHARRFVLLSASRLSSPHHHSRPSKSHRIPHPLTLLESYLFKNSGGTGHLQLGDPHPPLPAPLFVLPAPTLSGSLTKSFPYLVTSLPTYFLLLKSFNCNTYKKAGGWGPASSSYFPSASVSVNSAPSLASVLNQIPLLFPPPSRDEKPVTATPSKSAVTKCDARKSFRIRFYENCRVSTPTTLILELTPSPRQPHSHPFFSCTYVEPILQPLCFDIHPCNGGCTRLPLPPYFLTSFPIPCEASTHLRAIIGVAACAPAEKASQE